MFESEMVYKAVTRKGGSLFLNYSTFLTSFTDNIKVTELPISESKTLRSFHSVMTIMSTFESGCIMSSHLVSLGRQDEHQTAIVSTREPSQASGRFEPRCLAVIGVIRQG